MRHVLASLALATLTPLAGWAAAPEPATSAPQPRPGKMLFDRWCAECHAPGHGHPGTQQLERIRGAKLSLLESRTDLEAAFIRYVVRNGQNAMPAYRPSEISEAGLEQIARYLGRPAPPAGKKR